MRRVTVSWSSLPCSLLPCSAQPTRTAWAQELDAQCGGACHGDADMNRSSTSTVVVEAPGVAYEGLLTSVAVTVSDIETTTSGLLGFFLLSSLTGPKTHRPMQDGPLFPTAKAGLKTTSKSWLTLARSNIRYTGRFVPRP